MKLGAIANGTVLAAIAIGMYVQLGKTSSIISSDVALANVEALTVDLEEVTITCNSGYQGKCFRESLRDWKMCGEHMFHPCEFTGYQADSCTQPC